MEKHWERTIPFIKIDKRDIERIMNSINEFDSITSIKIIDEGCRTSNYIIEDSSNHKYLLKLSYKTEKNSNGEKKVLDLLENVVPVQKIYTSSNLPWNNNIEYTVYDYIDGDSIARYVTNSYKISEKTIKSIAKTLANIHRLKFSKTGILDSKLNIYEQMPSVILMYEKSIGDNAARRLGAELVYKIKELVKDNEEELLSLDKDPRLVHGDFQGNNILIKNESVVGIIDWEFTMAGHPIADIGQFFRYDKYFNEKLIKIFEEEYNKISDYKLQDDWYKIAKIRDLISLIQLMNLPKEMPIKHKEIREIIKSTVNSYL